MSVMRVMKMGNIVFKAGFHHTRLVILEASMLTSAPYPPLPVYVVPCLRDQYRLQQNSY